MFIDIRQSDIDEALESLDKIDRPRPGILSHHNRHNPLAIAMAREYQDRHCVVTPKAVHSIRNGIQPLTQAAKDFLLSFLVGHARATQRLALTQEEWR